jgi:RNA polymerase sigma-70 factor (ECF subfamily)
VTAYRALSTWRADGSFGAWLTRIAVRLALRRAARRRPVVRIDPIGEGGGRTSGGSAPSGSTGGNVAYVNLVTPAGHDPAVVVERGERDAMVRAAVAALDEPYREVVALRFFGELSLAEIAIAADRPLGTVKTHLHRGLLRLRTALEPQEADR